MSGGSSASSGFVPSLWLAARCAAIVLAACELAACAAAVPLVGAAAQVVSKGLFGDKPTRLSAQIVATTDTNPSPDGRPSPVMVRLYELNALGAFDSSDFISLYRNEDDVLKGEKIAREERILSPGEETMIEKELEDTVQYIGVLAGFQDYENAVWRASVPLKPGRKNKLRVELGADVVTIGPAE